MAAKREEFIQNGYKLFSQKSIDSVSMQEVANATGYGIATLYRYFPNKTVFVIAVAICKWKEFIEENQKRQEETGTYQSGTAAQRYAFFLDSFLDLYHTRKDLLRFNQIFNIYIEAADTDKESMDPYQDMIKDLAAQFHGVYELAEKDHTLRTDIQEIEIFSESLHLMLAAATRYAIGLVYRPEGFFNDEKELKSLRNMLFEKYTKI